MERMKGRVSVIREGNGMEGEGKCRKGNDKRKGIREIREGNGKARNQITKQERKKRRGKGQEQQRKGRKGREEKEIAKLGTMKSNFVWLHSSIFFPSSSFLATRKELS